MSEEEQEGNTSQVERAGLDEERQVGRSSPGEQQTEATTEQSDNDEGNVQNASAVAEEQQSDGSNNEGERVENSATTEDQQTEATTEQSENDEEKSATTEDQQTEATTEQSENDEEKSEAAEELQADGSNNEGEQVEKSAAAEEPQTGQTNNEEGNAKTSADEQQADAPTERPATDEEHVEKPTASDEQQAGQSNNEGENGGAAVEQQPDAPTEQQPDAPTEQQPDAPTEQQPDAPTEQANKDEGNVEQSTAPGAMAEDEKSVAEVGDLPPGAVTVETTSSDPRNPAAEQEDTPHVTDANLQTDDGAVHKVPVEIERACQEKDFLGGYRHKLLGTEYHHAAAQTPRTRRPDRGVVVFSRDTQTGDLISEPQQCPSSVTTQMTSVGCYISNLTDKLLSPRGYVTADEYHSTRLDAVIRLQAHTRRWLSTRAVDRLRRQRDRRLAWMDLQERRRREEREEQMQDSRNRWSQPQKREDLNLLYHALEKWRSDKEHQINTTLRGSERKAALCSLLEQETQYIATIGRHGIAIRSNNYNKAVRKFLDKSSTPHQWRAADGRLIEMDTPDTIRARELGDLYDCVAMSPISQEQRLDILLCLKQTVEEHPCQLTRDIVELLHREEDLMRRQVKSTNLEGLRKRLSTLFLQFIRTPGFNPEVAKHLKVPKSPSMLKNDVFLCHGCQRYLCSSQFRSCAKAHLGRRCLDCTRLRNIAGSRDDFSCYKNMLKRLRDSELVLNKDNTIPFLLQVEDLQYLVEVIWGARSALSACNDAFSLALVRWERHKDWSPWNCVLLSKEEVAAHLQVEDVHKVYDAPVIHGVEHKHLLARRQYNQIPTMVTQAPKATIAKYGKLFASGRIKGKTT
ncbi:IQ and ubiquitin-like domain-containing protein isoform X1 [Entelurus aequoreus]|uniref:IQ and ubiquitin-like domain-containing protein isoform X1 n=1 Tax=Entelurus aequoreus TaxID=161455 RepID=UPI002B1D29FB|nr:IQ and ubiquitin-like domain-containing protein isoform X1 [Entelurus aequoreus]